MKSDKLARKQLDKRLASFGKVSLYARPSKGWIHALRTALGMTTYQYAERLNVSQPRISQLEAAEKDKTVTLDTLERAARALGCTFVYALIPNEPLEQKVIEQAEKKARQLLRKVDHTMSLENQGLEWPEQQEQYQALVKQLLDMPTKKLWDKDI